MKTWKEANSATNENDELIILVAEDIKDCVSELIFISDSDATRHMRKTTISICESIDS